MTETVNVKSGWGVATDPIIELPSGSRVMVKELDIPEIIAIGVLDLVDRFSQEAVPEDDTKPKSSKEIVRDVTKDPERLKVMTKVANKVAAAAVVKPTVYLLADGEEVEEGKIYAHLIPFDDRMEIFAKAVAPLGSFLAAGEEQADDVVPLEDGESVLNKTE